MIRRLHTRLGGSSGFTLVELLVAMTLLTVVLGMTTTLFIGILHSNSYTSAETTDLDGLRQADSQLTKELREAAYVTSASNGTSITFWDDTNRDQVIQNSELVTYALASGTDGTGAATIQLRRSVAGSTAYRVVAQRLVNQTAFTYYDVNGNSSTTGSSTTTAMVKISLTSNASTGGQSPANPTITTEVFLRD